MMWRPVFLASVGLAAAGCASMRSPAAVESFPARFYATQVVTIVGTVNGASVTREFVTAVRREHDDVEIVFLDPVWQQALLKASCVAGRSAVTPLVEGVPLDVPGEEIVETARHVFGWSGALDANGSAAWQTRRFSVRIQEMAGNRPCRFPRIMELRPRLPDAPTITIVTKDWECPEP